MLKIYLDNCSLNRPFDDQNQMKIYLETEAIYSVFSGIRSGRYSLSWSFMLDYEISASTYNQKKNSIIKWKEVARDFCKPVESVLSKGKEIERLGMRRKDSLHLASAIEMQCNYFITTDKQIFNKTISGINTINPIQFVIEMEAKQ
jgi:hypothetical protein